MTIGSVGTRYPINYPDDLELANTGASSIETGIRAISDALEEIDQRIIDAATAATAKHTALDTEDARLEGLAGAAQGTADSAHSIASTARDDLIATDAAVATVSGNLSTAISDSSSALTAANTANTNSTDALAKATAALNTVLNDVPVGTIMMYSGVNPPPTNWAFCDGKELATSTYGELALLIQGLYGTAADSSHFLLPDMRHRVPVGRGVRSNADDPLFNTLNMPAGQVKHTLNVSEIPSHAHAHQHKFSTNTAGEHSHKVRDGSGKKSSSWAADYLPNDDTYARITQPAGAHSHKGLTWGPSPPGGEHSPGFDGYTGGTKGVPGSAAIAHSNLQPYIVLNYIIRILP